jgi:N utilization substance protein B
MIYQWDLTREPMDRVQEAFWQVRSTVERTRRRANELARGTQEAVGAIDTAIVSAATHWRLDRIAAVDRSILRLATYELLEEVETPSSVILDEAIEMAKRFGEAGSPSFVNGVLDAVKTKVRGAS